MVKVSTFWNILRSLLIFLTMKELEYLSEIWYAGCLDMCLVVSERISNLDKYFLV